MSWDPYLETLKNQGAIYYGIYSKAGAVCAQSANLNVSYDEILKIAACIEKKGASFSVNSWPCLLIFNDDEYVQGKTKAAVHEDAKVFFHAEATNTLIVVVGMVGANERDAAKIAGSGAAQVKAVGY